MELTENDRRNLKAFGLREHTCYICGKEFECNVNYVYKKYTTRAKGIEYYCSYTCMRKAEKDEKEKGVY